MVERRHGKEARLDKRQMYGLLSRLKQTERIANGGMVNGQMDTVQLQQWVESHQYDAEKDDDELFVPDNGYYFSF